MQQDLLSRFLELVPLNRSWRAHESLAVLARLRQLPLSVLGAFRHRVEKLFTELTAKPGLDLKLPWLPRRPEQILPPGALQIEPWKDEEWLELVPVMDFRKYWK